MPVTQNELLALLRSRHIPVQRVESAPNGGFRVWFTAGLNPERQSMYRELVEEMDEVSETIPAPPATQYGVDVTLTETSAASSRST